MSALSKSVIDCHDDNEYRCFDDELISAFNIALIQARGERLHDDGAKHGARYASFATTQGDAIFLVVPWTVLRLSGAWIVSNVVEMVVQGKLI